MRVFTSHERWPGAFFPNSSSLLNPVFCSPKRRMGKKKGGRRKEEEDCEAEEENRPSFFPPKWKTLSFILVPGRDLRRFTILPVLKQINFPFKKKSKQIGLKEAIGFAGPYYLFAFGNESPCTILKCRLRAFPSSI